MFYGVRSHKDSSFIYKDFLMDFFADRTDCELHLAVSREQEVLKNELEEGIQLAPNVIATKGYVQDLVNRFDFTTRTVAKDAASIHQL